MPGDSCAQPLRNGGRLGRHGRDGDGREEQGREGKGREGKAEEGRFHTASAFSLPGSCLFDASRCISLLWYPYGFVQRCPSDRVCRYRARVDGCPKVAFALMQEQEQERAQQG